MSLQGRIDARLLGNRLGWLNPSVDAICSSTPEMPVFTPVFHTGE
jgi:hypothetical protein